MHVVDTSDVQNYQNLGDDSGFVPAATFTFTNATKTLVITNASGTVPAGHAFAALNVEVFDRKGNKKDGRTTSATGTVTIDLDAATALDLTDAVDIKVTASTDKGFSKDGSFYGLLPIADAAGSLAFE